MVTQGLCGMDMQLNAPSTPSRYMLGGAHPEPHYAMIDTLSLLVSHGVILLTAWRLLSRPDLDRDPEPEGEAGDA